LCGNTEGQRAALNPIADDCTALVAAKKWKEATVVCYTIRAKVAEWTEDAFWT
jgi:hypothetical protein